MSGYVWVRSIHPIHLRVLLLLTYFQANADDTRFRLQGFLPVWIVSSFGNAAQARHRDVAGRQRKVYLSSLAGEFLFAAQGCVWLHFYYRNLCGFADSSRDRTLSWSCLHSAIFLSCEREALVGQARDYWYTWFWNGFGNVILIWMVFSRDKLAPDRTNSS